MRGPVTDEEIRAYMDAVFALCRKRERVYAVVLVDEGSFPNAAQRRIVASAITDHPELTDRIVAIAYVVPKLSSVARGILTAINWLVRKSWEETVTVSAVEAVPWLRERGAAAPDLAHAVENANQLFRHSLAPAS